MVNASSSSDGKTFKNVCKCFERPSFKWKVQNICLSNILKT
jgi:hypothetical protein